MELCVDQVSHAGTFATSEPVLQTKLCCWSSHRKELQAGWPPSQKDRRQKFTNLNSANTSTSSWDTNSFEFRVSGFKFRVVWSCLADGTQSIRLCCTWAYKRKTRTRKLETRN